MSLFGKDKEDVIFYDKCVFGKAREAVEKQYKVERA